MNKALKKINDSFLNENKYIFKKYKPIKKIGQGSFGSIYSVIRIKDKTPFAMKTEKINSHRILESEAYYLFTLQGFGFPKLISFGYIKKYYILIETLLGQSLRDLLKFFISITDICLIGMQILDRLEWIHSKDLLYRDIKPENFLMGIDDPNVIYIIDFGLCKKYRSSKTGKHILPKITGKFNGNLKFSSPYVIKGKESSRRDDLISLGYMLIFLFKKELPWDNCISKKFKMSKYFEMIYLKDTNGCGKLFKNIPDELANFIKYSKSLKFEQEPDYSYLRSLLNKVLFTNNINYKTLTFSWIDSKNKDLSAMPKSCSKRKSSPHVRLLKSITQERIKRGKAENLSVIQVKIDFNEAPSSQQNIKSSTYKQYKKFHNTDTFNNKNNLSKIISKKNLQNDVNKIIKNQKKFHIKEILYKKYPHKFSNNKILNNQKNNNSVSYLSNDNNFINSIQSSNKLKSTKTNNRLNKIVIPMLILPNKNNNKLQNNYESCIAISSRNFRNDINNDSIRNDIPGIICRNKYSYLKKNNHFSTNNIPKNISYNANSINSYQKKQNKYSNLLHSHRPRSIDLGNSFKIDYKNQNNNNNNFLLFN